MDRAYEGLCNILSGHRRKDDVIPVEALHVLKRDCDFERKKENLKVLNIKKPKVPDADTFSSYASLIRSVAQQCSEERGCKCGHDLMMGLVKGDHHARALAWEGYLTEVKNNEGHTDAERDGAWVPAIPL
jgi:hypothetical protein